jgi:hypothetical protein
MAVEPLFTCVAEKVGPASRWRVPIRPSRLGSLSAFEGRRSDLWNWGTFLQPQRYQNHFLQVDVAVRNADFRTLLSSICFDCFDWPQRGENVALGPSRAEGGVFMCRFSFS